MPEQDPGILDALTRAENTLEQCVGMVITQARELAAEDEGMRVILRLHDSTQGLVVQLRSLLKSRQRREAPGKATTEPKSNGVGVTAALEEAIAAVPIGQTLTPKSVIDDAIARHPEFADQRPSLNAAFSKKKKTRTDIELVSKSFGSEPAVYRKVANV